VSNFKIIENLKELPRLPKRITSLYLDVETVSGDPRRGAVLPYCGDKICGIAFTFDNIDMSWYLPIRHKPSGELFGVDVGNLPIELVVDYIQDLLDRSENWINHNIKFDAHFLHVEGIQITTKMVDTLTLAKLVDMQSKQYGYGLKQLAREWCGETTEEQDEIKSELSRRKTRDFGDLPASLVGEYACKDVLINRELWKEVRRRGYEGIEKVWDLEIELTTTLFEIECRGLLVDTDALGRSRESALSKIAIIENEIDELHFGEVNLSSTTSLSCFVVKKLGLPILGVTGSGKPSMNSEAIHGYMELDTVQQDPQLSKFFKLLDSHRDRSQFVSLYAEGWLNYINEREQMHPMYKQTVATGRMACANPNMQQLNKEAKHFIVPSAGNSLISFDYSQIEYRVIASLTRDEGIFGAYQNDPATDFHEYVAKLCGIDRKPAKTVNFGIAFGMGDKALTRALAKELGRVRAEQQATSILRTYNDKFPRIKQVANLAMRRAGMRGWIKTLYGRRRALEKDRTHKAFNTAVQGTAADIAKERLVVVNSDPMLLNAGVTVRAVVHDEFLFEAPTPAAECPEILEHIEELMTATTVDLGIPLLVSGGISKLSWAEI